MRRAAKYGDGWLPYMYTPEMVRESVGKIRQLRRELGVDGNEFRTGLYIFGSISARGQEAIDQAAQTLGRNYAQDFSKLAAKYTLSGTPEDCRKRIRQYVDAGVRTVVISWACRPEDVPENVRLFAEEVVPAFR